jgi:hypothetical protein
MADAVKVSRPDGSAITMEYEGDLLVADPSTERVVIVFTSSVSGISTSIRCSPSLASSSCA